MVLLKFLLYKYQGKVKSECRPQNSVLDLWETVTEPFLVN